MADTATLHVLFSSPAYWPAVEFGGPIWMARELNEGMTRRGHVVDVLTTSLRSLDAPPAERRSTRRRDVAGVHVHELATPLRYRWMGLTPSVAAVLRRLPPPDVGHVFGFRDPVGTAVALLLRRRRVPYVLEPLGMLRPKWRKVALKRVLDSTLLRPVVEGAAVIVATSEFERAEIVASGVAAQRVVIRGNGFPTPPPLHHGGAQSLRAQLDLPGQARLVLFVGRVAAGKGIPLLLDAAAPHADMHLVLVGPDGGDGTMDAVCAAARDRLRGRVHVLPPTRGERPLDLYGQADVFVLPSAGESFGMVAAEAAAAGTPSVVTDRCGIAEVLGGRGALVVPYDGAAIGAAIRRLLDDDALRLTLAEGARAVACDRSWSHMVDLQERIYRSVTEG